MLFLSYSDHVSSESRRVEEATSTLSRKCDWLPRVAPWLAPKTRDKAEQHRGEASEDDGAQLRRSYSRIRDALCSLVECGSRITLFWVICDTGFHYLLSSPYEYTFFFFFFFKRHLLHQEYIPCRVELYKHTSKWNRYTEHPDREQ